MKFLKAIDADVKQHQHFLSLESAPAARPITMSASAPQSRGAMIVQ
ncbi:hypothetical protein GJV26_18845 [Massilia dura]|uniref:Uncharacterized protein n=1 Tax=Pseudoduganella dura TaxID=321982 RepID=A0A6I3XDC4_9BURK|nr:hypothetical protein [Pseudoduganella dura]MUI14499.1 hypothetical protein [Pseudoduganella dura]